MQPVSMLMSNLNVEANTHHAPNAMAVAQEQEMKAYTQEMEAKVVEAQAEVPHAMAKALMEGKLGVMDYFNMMNVKSDTEMRNAISRAGSSKTQSAQR